MIEPEIKKRVGRLLAEVEREENVRIFYACESGSRAWGFPSRDSDYDVRFLYIHPVDWYLSIDKKRDVIERPLDDQIDLSGWEIRKALSLYRKSNPPLLEWLRSPMIYKEAFSTAQKLRELLPKFYSPVSCLYHYLHMAQGNFRDYLKHDQVWVKKYFYVLRPVLACKWIEAGLGPVPMEFDVLVNRIVDSEELKKTIDKLLEKKKKGDELSRGAKIPVLNEFLRQEIERLQTKKFEKNLLKPDIEKLNALFRSSLTEIWRQSGKGEVI